MATKLKTVEDELNTLDAANALAKLREPFPPNQISKLPKPYNKDSPKGKCAECGGYHGLPAVHLDYVGHAALTDRLLDVDPKWSWEPMGVTPEGLPALGNGGLWIKLTVCGVSRYGFGAADGKTGGNAVKEMIGDALRNAAMRFGAALDLWHKGDLHADEHNPETGEIIDTHSGPAPRTKLEGTYSSKTALKNAIHSIANAVAKASEIKEIDAAVKAGKAAIDQAKKDWPELLTGDPHLEGDDEGLRRMVARRREELTPTEDSLAFQLLVSTLNECATDSEYQSWLKKNGDVIDALDGAEGRKFEAIHDDKLTALKGEITPLAVGAFGG